MTMFPSLSCGNVYAEPGCYVHRDVLSSYPYCCPRSICPTNTFNDIISNSLDAVLGNSLDPEEEELQMAASDSNSEVRVSSPSMFQHYDTDMNSNKEDNFDYYDWDSIFAQYGSSF